MSKVAALAAVGFFFTVTGGMALAQDAASPAEPASQDVAANETSDATAPPSASPEPPAAEPAPGEQTPGVPAPSAPEPLATIPVAEDAAATPAKDATQLDEVVVTARKRQESLQDIPVSVTPFNRKEMEQRGYSGLEDIAHATAGFTFEPFMTGGAHANAVIRGLAQTFTTARIQNVSFFLDGIYLQRQSMLDLGLVDMERVEVVKGPQNALYGRNAFAGAVNYITLDPRIDREGYFSIGIGDNQRREYRLSVSGALDEDNHWLGKVSAGLSRYEGHTPNNHPVANADPQGDNLRGNLGGHDNATYALSLVYAPFDELRVRGSMYHSDLTNETGPGYSISGVHAGRFDLRLDSENDLNCLPGTVNDIGNPSPTASHSGFSAYCGELPRYASDVAPRKVNGMVIDPRAIGSVIDTTVGTLTADYELSDAISLHYLLGLTDHNSYTDGGASDEDVAKGRGIYVDATKDNQDPTAYVYANTSSGRPNSVLKSISHEIRADWEFSDAIRTSMGAYYSVVNDQEWTTLFISDLCNADTPQNIMNCNTPLSAPNTIAERTVLTAAPAYDQYYRQSGGRLRGEWTAFEDKVAAVFGSFGYKFSDTLDAAVEARISQENKKIERITDASMLRYGESVTYDPAEYPVLPIANKIDSKIFVPNDSAKYTDITPRGIVNWEWAPAKRVYFSAAKGVKAGGFNNSSDPAEQKYAPETNWTYELGSKNRLFHFITLNGALYYIDWTNLQGGLPPKDATLSSSDNVANIGGATNLGLELEANARLGDWAVDLGVTLSNPTYKDGAVFGAAIPNPDAPSQKIFCDDVTCRSSGEIGGNQLTRTSRQQGSLGINYSDNVFGWTLASRFDTTYQSKQYVEPVNLAYVPARQLFNASMNLQSPDFHWDVNFFVKNLTDLDYPANAFYIGVFDQYMVGKGPGRTFGTTLKYKF